MEKIAPFSVVDDVARQRSDVATPHPMAERAATARCPLLLTGETGAGKGFLAKWIHEHGPRANGSFVPVNCAAIPENLIDSHLFGHKKGSFSGADGDHLGLVRAADGGTILFDEISELPLTAQTRLLRLLEEREVQPVGYSKPVTVDVRVIAATGADLHEAVRQGHFREDLYFRLDVVRLTMKPLRERPAEIDGLLDRFNREFAGAYRHAPLRFDLPALQRLKQHDWPGNVREMRTVVERLHVLAGAAEGAVIGVRELQKYGQLTVPMAESQPPTLRPVQHLKVHAVGEALHRCRGNVARAATTLGVHRSTIYRWLASRETVAA